MGGALAKPITFSRHPREAWSTRAGAKPASVLPGAVNPQHPHVAGSLIRASVGADFVKHSEAPGRGQFTDTRRVPDRPETGVLPQPPYIGTDRRQYALGARPRTWLSQPSTRRFKVGQRLGRVDQRTRHALAEAD